ncbi:MAG: tRNA (adenosine(37)-N6)-threonylcarbamoyltransferase complex dimerization subunit type 1 TsaB [Geminocystis sp.]|nr:tRNA (adenosine(37)-N6)-threonylcarbamoyltransferase complex dimerization subunit type 1 TsaB [Geminocystis sp.]HIK37291.1 tRNA (adenosine(37)-N6)-threonylcarbamoyltransferase complex dimerization subunit type 1 TsaB [Geminocystis sp. M7585_C2015_104]MCS7148246.1 tRNA (adenosine(37)-N6)-threonylcarbamoyltransferase complex dimerization subunit type 1 TsaB [Geminocystis sp.]MCX8077661.1 tRNA (adenosine(37)-N6)-threonylcarbamoyltransferase complex dimerization subunit type 1 TsaB [Geminocystis 
MNKQGLALQTSTGDLGLAFVDCQGKFYCNYWDLGRELADRLQEILAGFVKEVTSWNKLDFLAVSLGPGSYTSTRIGVVTARILAQQLNLPVVGISNTELLAWEEAKRQQKQAVIAVEMPASNGEVYGAIYRRNNEYLLLEEVEKCRAMMPKKWQEISEEYKQRYPEGIVAVKSPPKLGYTAKYLLEISQLKIDALLEKTTYNWKNLLPLY